ncbi:MAG: TonB-dependent receptor [Bacteroidales bacterium]
MNQVRIHIFIILVFAGTGAFAQTVVNSTDSSSMLEVELGEVRINASRDNLKLREIPASVSVMSAQAINRNEVNTLSDASAVIPNFFMPDYGSKLTSPVYIRGIGSRINAPSVGMYVDGVPYFEKAAFDFDFFDVERIEVLRGPQGTLYGRNTMGGIVNIVTASPLDYQGTYIKLSAGNYNAYNVNAGHYGKLSENFGYSLAVNYLDNAGYFTNQYTGEKVDEITSVGLRNKLVWKLSDNFTLKNIASLEISRQGGYPYAIFNDSLNMAEDISYNQYSTYDRDLFSDALVATYSGNRFEIVSTTAYQLLDDVQDIDQDFTEDSLYFVEQRQKQHMLSQEVITRSTGENKYNWLLGAYGFLQAFDKGVDVDAYASGTKLYKQYDHTIGGYAFFHQSTLNDFLVDGLSLTAGIRVDYEKDVLDYTYDMEKNDNLTNLADTTYPSMDFFEVLPKVAINYRIGKTNLYATVAKGYKTGGFNSTFERPEDLTFNPEFSWNYEAGIKTQLIENRLHAELALFYIDWRHQQIYQTVPSGRGSMLKNAGHSVSRGVEVTLKTVPVKGYQALLTYGYTDAEFLSYEVDSTTSHSGNYIPYVPRHTVGVQLSKVVFLQQSTLLDKMRFNLQYRGAGEIFWNEENTRSQDYYGLVDAKVSFIKGAFRFDVWSKNLLGTDYNAFYFDALGNEYVQVGKPMRFGVNLSVRF